MSRDDKYIMDAFQSFLNSETLEFYSPIVMFLGGLFSLVLVAMLKVYVKQRLQNHKLAPSQALSILSRFEYRAKLSYGLMAFGALWILQMLFEKH